MCLLFIAHQAHPQWPLIIASNRDEFHRRATAPAAFWPDYKHCFGGKDLEAGGSWFLINLEGKLAALTNVRDSSLSKGAKSRGQLVLDAVLSRCTDDAIAPLEFGGFNLLSGHLAHNQWQFSVHTNNPLGERIRPLSAGVHGLSNAALNTPWPKLATGKLAVQQALSACTTQPALESALWNILADRRQAAKAQLPDTGIGTELETLLSSRFIVSEDYGTRASTLLLVDPQQRGQFIERSFDAAGKLTGEVRSLLHFQS